MITNKQLIAAIENMTNNLPTSYIGDEDEIGECPYCCGVNMQHTSDCIAMAAAKLAAQALKETTPDGDLLYKVINGGFSPTDDSPTFTVGSIVRKTPQSFGEYHLYELVEGKCFYDHGISTLKGAFIDSVHLEKLED